MTTEHDIAPARTESGYIPQLDGLRALAVGLVFCSHATEPYRQVPLFRGLLTHYGVLGVQIFFVLSGFLITEILLRTKTRQRYYSTFFIRRGLRLYPLFYTFLAVVVFSGVVSMHGGHLWPYAFYVSNLRHIPGPAPFGPLWSLCVEEQFYLVWPLIVFISSRRQLEAFCVAPIAAAVCLRFTGWLFWEHTLVNMDGLAMGALIASRKDQLSRYRAPALALAALLPLGVNLPGPLWFTSLLRTVQVASAAGMLVSVLRSDFVLTPLLRLWPIRYIGRISYGIYLLDSLVLATFMRTKFVSHSVVDHGLLRPSSIIVVEFVAVLALASASFYGLERPFLRMKDRVQYGAENRSPEESRDLVST